MDLIKLILDVINEAVLDKEQIVQRSPWTGTNYYKGSIVGHLSQTRPLDQNEYEKFELTKDPVYLERLLKSAEKYKNKKFKIKNDLVEGIYVPFELWELHFNPIKQTNDFINYPRYSNGMIPNNKNFIKAVENDEEDYPIVAQKPYIWLRVLFLINRTKFEASDRRQDIEAKREEFYYKTKDGIKKGYINVTNGKITKAPFSDQNSYKDRYQAFDIHNNPITYNRIKGGITFEEFKKILNSDEFEKEYNALVADK